MLHRPTRRALLQTAGLAGAGLATAGAATGLLTRPAVAAGTKHKVALSNSYIGNKWRIEMENVFKAALREEAER